MIPGKPVHGSGVSRGVYALLCMLLLLSSAALAQAPQQIAGPQVSAKLTTTRAQRFHGEKFLLTLTIVSRNASLGNQFNLSRLPANSIITLGTFNELASTQRRMDGVTEETRKFQCEANAVRTGRLHMAPILHFEIKKRERFLLGSVWVSSSRRISVAPLDLEIIPLPENGQPDSYTGAIGTFSFDVEVRPREVMVRELVTVSMKIKGIGRLEGITCPAVQGLPDLKTYPPRVIASSPVLLDFEQTVIPQSTNFSSIPALEFAYFDPGARRYRIIRRGAFPLKYRSGETEVAYTPFRPEGPQVIQKTAVEQVASLVGSTRADYYRTATFILTLVASLIALGGLVHIAMSRRTWKQGAVLLLIATAGGLTAVWTRHTGMQLVPDRALARATTVRLAPAHTALRSFGLPKGSVIKVREQWEHWLKIETEGKSGWVPADSVKTHEDSP